MKPTPPSPTSPEDDFEPTSAAAAGSADPRDGRPDVRTPDGAKGAPAAVKKAAEAMKSAAGALGEAWREIVATRADVRRPADAALDGAWSNLYGRLVSYAALPEVEYPGAAKAAALVESLFPDGLSFLRLPYNQQWAESDKRLKQIESEGWKKDIDRLAGPEFLEHLKAAHEEYGAVLGLTRRAADPPEPRPLAELLRELRKAIGRYVLRLLALEDGDEEANASIRKALRPIDELRAANAARRRPGAEDDGAEPAPNAPAEAPASGAPA